MWTTPKTDWTPNDYFNAVDFNRIKNNLVALRDLAVTLFPTFSIYNIGADRTPADYFYADEINNMENNLVVINTHTYNVNYGNAPTYQPNGPTMDFVELNRLEGAMADIYSKLNNQINGRRN